MMLRQIHLRLNGYGAMNGIAESNVHLALISAPRGTDRVVGHLVSTG
jgi:hypothetical protein